MKNKFSKLFFVFTLILLGINANTMYAATATLTGAGTLTTGTWAPTLPVSGDDIVVSAGATLTVDASFTIGKLTIAGTGAATINDAVTLTCNGAIAMTGGATNTTLTLAGAGSVLTTAGAFTQDATLCTSSSSLNMNINAGTLTCLSYTTSGTTTTAPTRTANVNMSTGTWNITQNASAAGGFVTCTGAATINANALVTLGTFTVNSINIVSNFSVASLIVNGGAQVIINDGVTLTCTGAITMNGGATNTTLTLAGAGSVLTTASSFTADATLCTNSSSINLNINAGTLNCSSFTSSKNTTTAPTRTTNVNLTTGTFNIDVNGSNLNGGGYITCSGAAKINAKGNLNLGTFTAGQSTVNMASGTPIFSANATFYNLTISQPTTFAYQSNVAPSNSVAITVTNTLKLNSILTTHLSTITLNSGASITSDTGFSSNAMINVDMDGGGVVVNGTTGNDNSMNMTLPFGSKGVYAPIIITGISAGTTNPTFKVSTCSGTSILNAEPNSLQRFWAFSGVSGINAASFNGTIGYGATEVKGAESSYSAKCLTSLSSPITWNAITGATVNSSLHQIELVNATLTNGTWGVAENFTAPTLTKYSVADGAWNATTTWNAGVVPATTDNVTILHNIKLDNVDHTINNLDIANNAQLEIVKNNLTVNGITNVAGNILDSDAAGNDTYVGLMDVKSSGRLIYYSAKTLGTLVFKGGLNVDGSGEIAPQFTTNDQIITGTGFLNCTFVDVQGKTVKNSLNNPVGLSCSSITGTGTFDNWGTLNYTGTGNITVPNFKADAIGNTVCFSSQADQNINAGTYHNIILNIGGNANLRKKYFLGNTIVNGDMTIQSSGGPSYFYLYTGSTAAQTITVNGNCTISDNRVTFNCQGTNLAHQLIVNGTFTNYGILNFRGGTNSYIDIILGGNGNVFTGNGIQNLRGLTFTGTGNKTVDVLPTLIFDKQAATTSLINNTAGTLEIKTPVTENGNQLSIQGAGVTLDELWIGNISANHSGVLLNSSISVNKLVFNTYESNRAECFDLNGNTLTITGDVEAKAGISCYLIGSNASSLIVNGIGSLTSPLQLRSWGTDPTNALQNLTINRLSGNVTLSSLSTTCNIFGTLTLNAGTLTSNQIAMQNSAPASIQRTNGNIIGSMSWLLPTGTNTGTYLFPVGTSTAYAPVEVTNPTFATGGMLQVLANNGATGGTKPAGFVNLKPDRYWYLNTSGMGVAFTNAQLKFTDNTITGDNFQICQSSTKGGTYAKVAGTRSGTSLLTNAALTSLNYFALGDDGTVTANPEINTEMGPSLSCKQGILLISNLVGKNAVRVMDALGRMISNKTVSGNSLEIAVPTSGMYVVQIQSGLKSWTKKVLL